MWIKSTIKYIIKQLCIFRRPGFTQFMWIDLQSLYELFKAWKCWLRRLSKEDKMYIIYNIKKCIQIWKILQVSNHMKVSKCQNFSFWRNYHSLNEHTLFCMIILYMINIQNGQILFLYIICIYYICIHYMQKIPAQQVCCVCLIKYITLPNHIL